MKLEIIVPFFGSVNLLKETISSVLNQSSPNWKLTIINDAHPDLTVDDWIQELSDSRINYIRNKINLGPSKNYNKGVKLATEEYCMILGADDLLHPRYVENIQAVINSNPNYIFYHPKVIVIDEYGHRYLPLVDLIKRILSPHLRSNIDKRSLKSIMIGNWLYFPSIVWRTTILQAFPFRDDINVCQDLWLISNLLFRGYKGQQVKDVEFYYRRFSGSDSSIKLLDGERFREERLVHKDLRGLFNANKKYILTLLAFMQITSRLHEASLYIKTKVINIKD